MVCATVAPRDLQTFGVVRAETGVVGGAGARALPGIAGRVEERAVLSAAIDGAADRRPCAVFVHGEAGVGKTRLVRAVCDDAAANGAAVLWGRCVRFGAVDTPYVALVGALEGWLESAENSERHAVLAAVPEATELLPSLGGQPERSMVRLLSVVDGVVRAVVSLRPTLLVVDDVQWADVASRDALTYLVAGFRSQRLAVLATYRDEELLVGDPMHAWLADLTRLPSVSSLRLDRMSHDETEDQLSLLLGGRPDPHLVAEVVRRSDGNPYLNELLLHGVTVADQELPADLPAELTEALLAAWHRLSAPSRELMRLLAIGGRPVSIEDLTEVATARGIAADAVMVALVEATNSGVCVARRAEGCWFRHPLLADALEATFVPGETVPIHAAWARALECRSRSGIDELRRLGDLALHYEGAHEPQRCLDTSRQAADVAHDLKAPQQEAVHLARAARLWSAIYPNEAEQRDDELDLLERLALVSYQVSAGEQTFAAWDRALELIDERRAPLRASRIIREQAYFAWMTGRRTGEPFDASKRAVELCRAFPNSSEYALALADLAECYSWTDSLDAADAAQAYAEEALRVAGRSGSHQALSRAYRALTYAYIRDERADHYSAECLRQAGMTHDPAQALGARAGREAFLAPRGRIVETIDMYAEGLTETLDSGALNMAAFYAGSLARNLLMFGRLREAEPAVRNGLTLTRVPHRSANVRLAAALLSVRRGEFDEARMHLLRARELIADFEDRPGLWAPPTVAECLVATGRPLQALEMLRRTLRVQLPDPRVMDEMLIWAARAAADLAEHARDHRDYRGVAHAQRLLEDIVELREELRPPPFERITSDDLMTPALEALFAAETARCLSESPTSALWERAAHRCAECDLQWEEAIANQHWAHALLVEGASRSTVAAPLRSAYRFAAESGAKPLKQQLETLAAFGNISLAVPETPSPDGVPQAFRSLTKREREILAYLAAGRTYAEIANVLFISQKTVSSHVSNLLHKTGTSSRREVAALAARLGYP
jgi:DNA-binding CsgD family transcriptional regulator